MAIMGSSGAGKSTLMNVIGKVQYTDSSILSLEWLILVSFTFKMNSPQSISTRSKVPFPYILIFLSPFTPRLTSIFWYIRHWGECTFILGDGKWSGGAWEKSRGNGCIPFRVFLQILEQEMKFLTLMQIEK